MNKKLYIPTILIIALALYFGISLRKPAEATLPSASLVEKSRPVLARLFFHGFEENGFGVFFWRVHG